MTEQPSLYEIDCLVNGVPVHLFKGKDGTIWASHLYKVRELSPDECIGTIRVPVDTIPDAYSKWKPETHPIVKAAIKKHSAEAA